MKLTHDMIQEIKDAAEDLRWDYDAIGVRIQDDIPFELGPISHLSHVWDDGEDTGEELPGICTVNIDALSGSHIYFGDHVAIICGNCWEYGEDPGEIIISDPVVVRVIC